MEAAEYHPIQSAIDKEVSQKQRYARFQDRQEKSDMPTNMMLKIAHGKIHVNLPFGLCLLH